MSFGEGNLHERVAELEESLGSAKYALHRYADACERKDGRIAELESLSREAGAFIDGILNRCYTINVSYGHDLLARMGEAGIGVER